MEEALWRAGLFGYVVYPFLQLWLTVEVPGSRLKGVIDRQRWIQYKQTSGNFLLIFSLSMCLFSKP